MSVLNSDGKPLVVQVGDKTVTIITTFRQSPVDNSRGIFSIQAETKAYISDNSGRMTLQSTVQSPAETPAPMQQSPALTPVETPTPMQQSPVLTPVESMSVSVLPALVLTPPSTPVSSDVLEAKSRFAEAIAEAMPQSPLDLEDTGGLSILGEAVLAKLDTYAAAKNEAHKSLLSKLEKAELLAGRVAQRTNKDQIFCEDLDKKLEALSEKDSLAEKLFDSAICALDSACERRETREKVYEKIVDAFDKLEKS